MQAVGGGRPAVGRSLALVAAHAPASAIRSYDETDRRVRSGTPGVARRLPGPGRRVRPVSAQVDSNTGIRRNLRLRLKRLAYEGLGGGRDRRLQPDRVVEWLGVGSGMRVADIGSGFGYFAFRFADRVGDAGVVYAIDTDADLRGVVRGRAATLGLHQVHAIEAVPDDPAIPEPVDLVFLSASFHHLPDRADYCRRLRGLLRPEGRLAILEATPGRFSGLFGHVTAPEEVRSVLADAGYREIGRAGFVQGASLQVFAPSVASTGPDTRA